MPRRLFRQAGLCGQGQVGGREIGGEERVLVTGADLLSASRRGGSERRRRQVEAKRILSGVAFGAGRVGTKGRVYRGAPRRRLDGVLDAKLRPEQEADLHDAENEGDENWEGQREFSRGRRSRIAYEKLRRGH